jgi:hypothetical protein
MPLPGFGASVDRSINVLLDVPIRRRATAEFSPAFKGCNILEWKTFAAEGPSLLNAFSHLARLKAGEIEGSL